MFGGKDQPKLTHKDFILEFDDEDKPKTLGAAPKLDNVPVIVDRKNLPPEVKERIAASKAAWMVATGMVGREKGKRPPVPASVREVLKANRNKKKKK